MNTTGWLRGLRVTADGTGIVSHAGVALVRALADNIGLTAGLSKALASDRLLVHDRGRVLADLACAIADGAEVISDFRVIGDQEDLFGLVASVPTAWRTLDEIARGGERALGKLTAAVDAARRQAWAAAAAAQLDRDYIREKTLEGQAAAAAKGNHGGRPKVIDDDMLTFAIALKNKGTPVPQIAGKLVIKTGKNAGKHPSVASLYRALAEADDSAA